MDQKLDDKPEQVPNFAVPSPRKTSKTGKYTLSAIGIVILAAGSGAGGSYLYESYLRSSLDDRDSDSHQLQVVTSEEQLFSNLAKTVGPSVVSIDVTSEGSQPTIFGYGAPTTQQSAGTGVVLSADGLIVTNRHVVPTGATSVDVTLSDGTQFKNVKVLGRTADGNSLDIAFLQIEDLGSHKLTPAKIGDSSKVVVGQKVLAIGNALGQFQNSVTDGIISGYGRSVVATDGGSGSETLQNMFQTNAAINPGNSGGPLINLSGQVIGINTAVAGNGAQNIGFSIPINDIKGLIHQVESTGQLKQPFLGVRYVPITKDYSYIYNLPVDEGAYIMPSEQSGSAGIAPGSPAEQAGLHEKDIITKIDNTKIDKDHSLESILNQHQPGDEVKITILRDNKTKTISVKLGTMPDGES